MNIIDPYQAEMPQVTVVREIPDFSEQELWEKYLELTKDLLKFINKGDVDTFVNIIQQRDVIFQMLRDAEPHVFGNTEAGAAIREQIKPMDQEILYKARTWLNKSKRQNMAVKSYDITGYMPAGNVFNKEY